MITFVRGSGSVWGHLSTISRVQVWFRFTEVKFCWFRFGSGSPKWNGSFGFTVRVQVRFDTLCRTHLPIEPGCGGSRAENTIRPPSLHQWSDKMSYLNPGMAIASHRIENRIPRFFPKNIASNYRIKTTKKIASVIALQNLTKKICDFFDYFDFFVFNSI